MAADPSRYSTRNGMRRRAHRLTRNALARIGNGAQLSSMPLRELLDLHRDLHDAVESLAIDEPPHVGEDVLAAERLLSKELARRGVAHRYDDVLARVAGTSDAEWVPSADSVLQEAAAYATMEIGLSPNAVSLVAPLDQGKADQKVYVLVHDEGLKRYSAAIANSIGRTLPPGLTAMPMSAEAAADGLGKQLYVYDLRLALRPLLPSRDIVSLTAVAEGLKADAISVSKVFKDAQGPFVPFSVTSLKEYTSGNLKAPTYERVVTGVVLEPGIVDASASVEHGTEGDIYDEEDIRKAMYWWMEHADHTITFLHQQHGGQVLTRKDVALLENWQKRATQTMNNRTIRKGTWMSSDRVYNPGLWDSILSGRIRGWSAGIRGMAGIIREEIS